MTDRLATRLVHLGRAGTRAHGFVNPPLHRGSTVLYPDMETRRAQAQKRFEQAIVYGTHGTATHHALEDAIAAIEGGARCQIVSTGLAAVTTALLALLRAGDHLLVPDSVYGPTRLFCDTMLKRLDIATDYYPADANAEAIAPLFRDGTVALFLESPGSHSFEVQDVPALVAAARARNVLTLIDNTWGIAAFQPFAHGVDVSIQALTKYPSGHSDILLGAITVAEERLWRPVRDAALQLGQYASPDDCWLCLRGLRTLGVRLAHQERAGLTVASWFARRPEVATVLHPALPGAPGHALWKRDFSGAASLFGVVFRDGITAADTHRMVERLRLFGIGASWGGYESLALPTTGFVTRTAGPGLAGAAVRFHIGLEDTDDLIADLTQAFAVFAPPPLQQQAG